MDLQKIEAWVVTTAVKVALIERNPVALGAVAAKSALQIAKNEGCLDPANRSSNPVIAEVQSVAADVEDATDPYLHVDRNVLVDVVPGGKFGVKVGTFLLRNAPLPAVVKATAFDVVENVLEKIEGPSPGSGNQGLAA